MTDGASVRQTLPWLNENKNALGFSAPQTAQKLMQAADKYRASAAFTEAEAAHPGKEKMASTSLTSFLKWKLGKALARYERGHGPGRTPPNLSDLHQQDGAPASHQSSRGRRFRLT